MVGSYLVILRRNLVWIAVLATVIGVSIFVYLTSQVASYRSDAVIEVTFGTTAEQLLGQQRSYEEPQRRVTTEAELVTSRPVAALASARLRAQGLAADPQDLLSDVTATARRSSNYIEVAGTAATPRRAQLLTQAFAESYVAYRRSLQQGELEALRDDLVRAKVEATRELAAAAEADRPAVQSRLNGINQLLDASRLRQSLDTGNETLLSEASLPQSPDNEVSTTTAASVAALAGLLLALGLILAQELLHDTLRTKTEAARLTPLPVLGVLRGGRAPRSVTGSSAARPLVGEGERAVRLALANHLQGRPAGRILLVSLPSDALSCLASARSLAASCAATGQSVLLVADSVEDEGVRGQGHEPLVRSPTTMPGVHEAWATAGGIFDVASPVQVLDDFARTFDIVVIVASGLHGLQGSDVAPLVDAVLPVCVLERTPAKRFAAMIEMLVEVGAVVPGLLLMETDAAGDRGRGRTLRFRSKQQDEPDVSGRGSAPWSDTEQSLGSKTRVGR